MRKTRLTSAYNGSVTQFYQLSFYLAVLLIGLFSFIMSGAPTVGQTMAMVGRAYQWAYARAATADEIQFSLEFLREAAEKRSQDRLSVWAQFAQAILAANEFTWID